MSIGETRQLAAAYREEPVDADALQPFRAAIERLLHAHEPYPAMVVDRHWNMIAANQASSTLFGEGVVGTNMVRSYVYAREVIANWPDAAKAALRRLRQQQQQAPLDGELRALVEVAEAAVADLPAGTPASQELIVCPHFRIGDDLVRTIVMTARFDDSVQVTLAELRIELTYPQDEDAKRFFRARSMQPVDGPVRNGTTSAI